MNNEAPKADPGRFRGRVVSWVELDVDDDNAYPFVAYYDAEGELVAADQRTLPQSGWHVSFNGERPRPLEVLSRTELGCLAAWSRFCAADAEREAEGLARARSEFSGYPRDATLGEIRAGTATRIMRPVEAEVLHRDE